MSKNYSLDLCERVVGAISGGLSCRDAARYFDISPPTVIGCQQRMNRSNAGILHVRANRTLFLIHKGDEN